MMSRGASQRGGDPEDGRETGSKMLMGNKIINIKLYVCMYIYMYIYIYINIYT